MGKKHASQYANFGSLLAVVRFPNLLWHALLACCGMLP